jgi:hypothetical protein
MRLGRIQSKVVGYLASRDGSGVICSTTKAEEFAGLDLAQVNRAISGLLRRRIIKREGIRYILMEAVT